MRREREREEGKYLLGDRITANNCKRKRLENHRFITLNIITGSGIHY